MPVNPKKIFVVHGRNWLLRDHMIAFLRKLELSPISWGAAVRLTGIGAPYIGQAIDAALREAQVVIVLLTGDDEIQVGYEAVENNGLRYEQLLMRQPRPNVLFEAGMAFTRLPDRTILIEFENVRPCSVLDGRYRIRLSNSFAHRMGLIRTLESLHCAVVRPSNEIIRNTGDFSVA